jgi:hypothetical protein
MECNNQMKIFLGTAALALAIAITTVPAEAKGCIKGALVGGTAGHLAHHTLIGAAAGCVIGHHEAAKHDKEMQNPAPASGPTPVPDPTPTQKP